ncbi:MAG: toll/interleukin-1 receptor domain-containing protein [Myxococcota bacterium]
MKIFISYRRRDTRHLAGRLSDVLGAADGVERVFIDVESIAPGAEFEPEMIRALEESDVCLALIGEGWAAEGRIQEERDPVRLEIRAALAAAESGRLNLTPILVDGAPMPQPASLPPDLRPLCGRNARPLSHGTFRSDLEALARQLGIDLAPDESSTLAVVGRTLFGGGIALVAVFLVSLVHRAVLGQSMETTLGGQPALVAAIVVAIAIGLAAPNVGSWTKKR